MPIDSIKKWLFKKEQGKKIKASEANNMIGVFLDADLGNLDISHIKEILAQKYQKHSIVFLAFINEKEIKNQVSLPFYCQSHIKWAGFPENEAITEFLSKKYSRFYYLSNHFDKHQEFIVSKVNADFKAGLHNKGIEQYLNFILDTKEEKPEKALIEIEKTLLKFLQK